MSSCILTSQCLDEEFAAAISERTIIVSCGTKKSGKTTFLLAVLRGAIERNAFEDYVLILPSFFIEADNSYSWIRARPEVTISTKYHTSILERLHTQNTNTNTQRHTLFVIDDATQFATDLHNPSNKHLIAFVSESRHIRITTWILVHTLKNVLSPVMRENVGWLIIYDISNRKLLDDIWQEYLSCECDLRDFISWFRKLSRHQFSSFLLKTSKLRLLDAASNDWPWVVNLRNENNTAKRRGRQEKNPAATNIRPKCQGKDSRTKSEKSGNDNATASDIGETARADRESRGK